MERTLSFALVHGLAIAGFSLGLSMAKADDPLVVKDGKTLCDKWLPMLAENPKETVIFTGHDEFGQKVKVLVNRQNQEWRFVLLAGTEKPLYGCEFLAGSGFVSQ